MTATPRTVVVFGATSYVGQFVLKELVGRGARVHAIVRNPATADILLHPFQRDISTSQAGDLPFTAADAVINLAYVKQPVPVGILRRNARLVAEIHRTTVTLRAPVLIHVSSAAVFGYQFAAPPQPRPAPRWSGDSYIDLKIHAERRLLAHAARASYALVILRPGNVVGPNSPTWVVALLQRMLEGRPVALAAVDGLSNATYTGNLAHYLSHLAHASRATLTAFGRYHHIAEFSDVRWSRFIRALAHAVGIDPEYASTLPRSASGPTLAAKVLGAYRGALGLWVRRSLGQIPSVRLGDRLYLELKTRLATHSLASDRHVTPSDVNYLRIMSAAHQFANHVLPDWQPPIDFGTALDQIVAPLADTGGVDVGRM